MRNVIERYVIAAGLLLFAVLAGAYIAHGKPVYVPNPAPVMKCQRSVCDRFGKSLRLRRVV